MGRKKDQHKGNKSNKKGLNIILLVVSKNIQAHKFRVQQNITKAVGKIKTLF